jgi:hypothetical protein
MILEASCLMGKMLVVDVGLKPCVRAFHFHYSGLMGKMLVVDVGFTPCVCAFNCHIQALWVICWWRTWAWDLSHHLTLLSQ